LRSLSIRESQLGADHPDVATSLNNLALLYTSQGRYSEAEPLYMRSLSIRESQLGADHPSVGTSLNNLALLYESQGRYSEAEPFYQRALQICEQSLGIAHPNTMTVRANYAQFSKNGHPVPHPKLNAHPINLFAFTTKTTLILLNLIASNPKLTQSLREALQSQTETT
jgi:tetratricopeptide (TPR) repeat protein